MRLMRHINKEIITILLGRKPPIEFAIIKKICYCTGFCDHDNIPTTLIKVFTDIIRRKNNR